MKVYDVITKFTARQSEFALSFSMQMLKVFFRPTARAKLSRSLRS